jgi:thiol-disulfide isomerase/thioredoxin
MPLLEAVAKKYAARGVVLVGLDEDEGEDLAEVKQAMAPFSYPALMAESAEDDGFRAPRVLPVTYVIDASGIVRAKLWPGGTPVTEESLEKALAPLLAPPA